MEIILGIDNIVFIAILTGKLEPSVQSKARKVGLAMAMVTRIALLMSISWIMGLDKHVLIDIGDHHLTAKHLVLLVGGIFLIFKSTREIHEKFAHAAEKEMKERKVATFTAAVVQIMFLDIIFSLDSVITAVGTAKHMLVMIAAVIIAVLVMMLFANAVARFVEKNPTIKMLALSFLLMIGVMLVAESLGKEIEKGYIYFAMAFSLLVEMMNIWTTRKPAKKEDTAPKTEPS
ncbi:MAG TPA: TerC family protein [Planctomycetota bacterium]|nr:TerC family protein [Planctomycetota bacterium]